VFFFFFRKRHILFTNSSEHRESVLKRTAARSAALLLDVAIHGAIRQGRHSDLLNHPSPHLHITLLLNVVTKDPFH